MSSAPSKPFSELRKVLRRCENAAVTSVRSTPSRPMSKRGFVGGPQAHDGGPDFGTRLERTGTDVEQRFDLGDGREHDGQASIVLGSRLCGHSIHDFLLQHEIHVCDGGALRQQPKQQRSGNVVRQVADDAQRRRPCRADCVKSVCSTFSTCTRSPSLARGSACSAAARSRSISITSKRRARSSSPQVSAPRPGPTSTSRSEAGARPRR